jgi:hypothetical protein
MSVSWKSRRKRGSSECLPEYTDRETSADCSYENYITSHSRTKPLADFEEDEWAQMRSTYARGLLRRGLMTYANRQEAEGQSLAGRIYRLDRQPHRGWAVMWKKTNGRERCSASGTSNAI